MPMVSTGSMAAAIPIRGGSSISDSGIFPDEHSGGAAMPSATKERGHPMRSMTVVFVALVIGLALPAVASAQETSLKIGYIDSEEIIKAAPGYTEANDAFNRTATAWRDSLDAKRTQLQTLFDEYKAQEVILSPENKTEKQQQMLGLEQEIQQYFQAKFGQEAKRGPRKPNGWRPASNEVKKASGRTAARGGRRWSSTSTTVHSLPEVPRSTSRNR